MHTQEKKGKRGKKKERRERNQLRTASMYQYKSTSVQFYTFYTCFGAGLSNFISSQVSCPRRYLSAEEMTTNIWLHQSGLDYRPNTQQKGDECYQICVSNYTARVLEGDKVCLLSQSRVGERMLLKSLNGTPHSIAERQRQREKSLSADQSYQVLITISYSLVGPQLGPGGFIIRAFHFNQRQTKTNIGTRH